MKNRSSEQKQTTTEWEFAGDSRIEAMAAFKFWNTNPEDFVFLDTETTGLDGHAQILEIAVCDFGGMPLLESLVKPVGIKDWKEAEGVHHISPEDVIEAPSWSQILPEVESVLSGKKLLIYNAAYDMRLMRQASLAANCQVLHVDAQCVMREYAKYRGIWSLRRRSWKWHKLDNVARALGVERAGTAHRALSDAALTAAICRAIVC